MITRYEGAVKGVLDLSYRKDSTIRLSNGKEGTMERADRQKEKILKCAHRLFLEQGFSATTTREIAAAAEIQKGLLHYYFPKKDDIMGAMFEGILEGLFEYLNTRSRELNGVSFYAALNLLLITLLTSEEGPGSYMLETPEHRATTELKIRKLSDIASRVVEENRLDLPEYPVFLAVAASVGAETELFLNIQLNKARMTYRKLAILGNKIFFTLLKIPEHEIIEINRKAQTAVDGLDLTDLMAYLAGREAWL